MIRSLQEQLAYLRIIRLSLNKIAAIQGFSR